MLTVDHARHKGKISSETNLQSYLRTLEILKAALDFGRVTASIQGTRNPKSPLYIGKTRKMFKEALSQAGFGIDELKKLNIDDRSYTKAGRAQDLNDDEMTEDCDVIPDPDFLKSEFPRMHSWRGMIRANGAVVAQPNRPGKTYGDSVNNSLWQGVEL